MDMEYYILLGFLNIHSDITWLLTQEEIGEEIRDIDGLEEPRCDNEIIWLLTQNGLEEPRCDKEYVAVSREHGTFIRGNNEYTLLRIDQELENSGSLNYLVRTTSKPDNFNRILD